MYAGHATPRDLVNVAVDAVLSMESQPRVLQQSAVLAGIASVRQVHDQQVRLGWNADLPVTFLSLWLAAFACGCLHSPHNVFSAQYAPTTRRLIAVLVQ